MIHLNHLEIEQDIIDQIYDLNSFREEEPNEVNISSSALSSTKLTNHSALIVRNRSEPGRLKTQYNVDLPDVRKSNLNEYKDYLHIS